MYSTNRHAIVVGLRFDWAMPLSDYKVTGIRGPCQACGSISDHLTRLTYPGLVDRYICYTCAQSILAGRVFDIFHQEVDRGYRGIDPHAYEPTPPNECAICGREPEAHEGS